MIKACIFDLDGTIGNTLDSMVYSVNLTLKEMNLSEISKEQCREFVGNGARVLMEKALDASGNPGATRIEEGMQIYGRIFDENCTYHVTPCEGVPEMLYKLKKQGVKLAVLSNKPHCQAVKVVHAIYGEKLFDWVQDRRMKFQENRIRRECLCGEKAWLDYKECLYVGDSGSRCGDWKECRSKNYRSDGGFCTKRRVNDCRSPAYDRQGREIAGISIKGG